jgi:TRAP-type C4-dicarboxylate transport system substrate-binding protein
VVLRLATNVPDGSAWAREARAFGNNVELRTEGRVRIKWYFGGIAGDEVQALERLKRGAIEGVVSGGPACAQIMPSLRALEVPGLFQSADEARLVVNQLGPTLTVEAQRAGFAYLGSIPLGGTVYFGRRPVRTLAELRAAPMWVWDQETTLMRLGREMGLQVEPTQLEHAARDFDAGRVQGFWALPAAALAFQWSAQAPYLVDLRGQYLFACTVISNRAFGLLSPDAQHQLLAAAAQLRERGDAVSRQQEETLLHGGFQHQGVKIVPMSETFRAEFLAAANAARDKLAASLISPDLLQRVSVLLSEARAGRKK